MHFKECSSEFESGGGRVIFSVLATEISQDNIRDHCAAESDLPFQTHGLRCSLFIYEQELQTVTSTFNLRNDWNFSVPMFLSALKRFALPFENGLGG